METNILNQIIGNSSHDHDRINRISEVTVRLMTLSCVIIPKLVLRVQSPESRRTHQTYQILSKTVKFILTSREVIKRACSILK